MNGLISKRFVRILSLMLIFIVGFHILGMKGYWIDTKVLVTMVGFPELFGSLWFNIVALGFAAISIYLLSKRDPDDRVPIIEFVIAICIFISIFSPFIGLLVPLLIIACIIVAAIIIAIMWYVILWISEIRATGKVIRKFYAFKHKMTDFFWD